MVKNGYSNAICGANVVTNTWGINAMALNHRSKNISQRVKSKKISTGPISESGKAKSSKNATMHGVTSTWLLGDVEQNKYDALLAELKESYPTTNPLIRIQLERIAKLNVQLEHIQKYNRCAVSSKQSTKSRIPWACPAPWYGSRD